MGLALPCYLQWQRRLRRWYSSDLSSVLKIEGLLRNSGSQDLQQMPPTTTTTLIIICGGSCLWLDSKFPVETARIMASVVQVQWFQIESRAERRIPQLLVMLSHHRMERNRLELPGLWKAWLKLWKKLLQLWTTERCDSGFRISSRLLLFFSITCTLHFLSCHLAKQNGKNSSH